MVTRNYFVRIMMAFVGIVLLSAILSNNAFAHCDTLDGPVVQTARIALESGDVTPLLKWVQADDEKEIRVAFQKTLAVRAKGIEAKDLVALSRGDLKKRPPIIPSMHQSHCSSKPV